MIKPNFSRLDQTLRIWDNSSGASLVMFIIDNAASFVFKLITNNRSVLYEYSDESNDLYNDTLQIIDLDTHEKIKVINSPKKNISFLKTNLDKNLLYIGLTNGKILVKKYSTNSNFPQRKYQCNII